MRRRLTVVSLVFLAAAPAAVFAQYAQKKTLYERLGGYDAIAKIVDDFLPRLSKDPKIAAMIGGLATTSRMRNRQLIVDQLCNETGGPCLYVGRTMEQAHQGLEINDQLWEFSQKALGDSLDASKVGEPERGELLALVEKHRAEIIEKKQAAAKKPQ